MLQPSAPVRHRGPLGLLTFTNKPQPVTVILDRFQERLAPIGLTLCLTVSGEPVGFEFYPSDLDHLIGDPDLMCVFPNMITVRDGLLA
jgi:hypothetical protein